MQSKDRARISRSSASAKERDKEGEKERGPFGSAAEAAVPRQEKEKSVASRARN